MDYFRDNLTEYLNFFGYTESPDGSENPTEIFKLTADQRANVKRDFMGYKAHNAEVLKGNTTRNHKEHEFEVQTKVYKNRKFTMAFLNVLKQMQPIEVEQ